MSKCIGVSLITGGKKWEATITVNGVFMRLGQSKDYFEVCCLRKSKESEVGMVNILPKEFKTMSDTDKISSIRRVIHYNMHTGVLTRIAPILGQRSTGVIDSKDRLGYIKLTLFGVSFRGHTLAWALHYGHFPKLEIDHINRNTSDNRISNLRDVSRSVNARNKGLKATNKSGFTGVSYNKHVGKWVAQVRLKSKSIIILYTDDKFEAICARQSYNNKHRYYEVEE